MAQTVPVIDLRAGMKVEIDGHPYSVVSNDFVKPGKGTAFNRVKLKHLIHERALERTFKSNESITVADVVESTMRLLFFDAHTATFMDDKTFEQEEVQASAFESIKGWLVEDKEYAIIFYNGNAVSIEPPTFMELKITETSPGVRGDTASSRVMKPAILETGAKIQIPIFVEQDEVIKVDTRTGDYVSRVSK